MVDPATLGVLCLIALAGSLHCAGMCGGFAALVAARARSSSQGVSVAMGTYLAGKACSYAIIGTAIALLTTSVDRGLHDSASTEWAHSFQSAMATFTGVALIVAGLASIGLRLPGRWKRVHTPFRKVFDSVRSLPGAQSSLGVGLLTGLLPCGLSWSAFAVAAGTDPGTAAVGLFLFGLSTGPALILMGAAGAAIPLGVRRFGPWIVGPLLIVLGALTAIRGELPTGLEGAKEALPECCSGAS